MASLLVDLGVICGAVIAVLTAITLVSRLPPVRWLWTQLISGPLGRWTKGLVRDGAAEFHEQIVAPQMEAIQTDVTLLLEQSATSWHKDKAWIVGRVAKIEVALALVERRQAVLINAAAEALNDPNSEASRVRLLDTIAQADLVTETHEPPERAD